MIKSVTVNIAGHLQEFKVQCFDEEGREVFPDDAMPRYYTAGNAEGWNIYERANPRDVCLLGGYTEESAREMVSCLNGAAGKAHDIGSGTIAHPDWCDGVIDTCARCRVREIFGDA